MNKHGSIMTKNFMSASGQNSTSTKRLPGDSNSILMFQNDIGPNMGRLNRIGNRGSVEIETKTESDSVRCTDTPQNQSFHALRSLLDKVENCKKTESNN